MWKDTRMVVLTALSAALYSAILIPFKIFPIIPGVTEIRPANAIPVVCGILFGPAGAWGSAFGNLIGDFFFGLGPGSSFGMVGNFLYGFVPYAFWRAMFGNSEPDPRRTSHWIGLLFICVVASAACAFTIAWGIDIVIRGVPFAILGSIIFFNNLLMAVLLAPPLLFALLPRVKRWGLLYTEILPPVATARPRFVWVGVALMTVGSLGGLAGGVGMGYGIYSQPFGLPYFIKAFKERPAPAVEPAKDAKTAKPAPAAKASAPAAAKPALAPAPTATAPAGSVPMSPRMAMGLGLVPALLLVLLGFLLL
jgi:energy-coupling factor transport system substrate-specific component